MRNSKCGMTSSRRAPSVRLAAVAAFSAALALAIPSHAQAAAEGYAVERLNPGAPGNSWLIMDDLKLEGPLGGAVSVVTGYARRPLRVSVPGNAPSLSVISDQAFVDVGLAILYDRFRFTLDIPDPLYIRGQSGTVGNTEFAAPLVDVGRYPDKVTDIRLGLDARLWGDVRGPLRLGASAQLFVPSGERANYATDATYRSLLRLQFAGDWGMFNHAGFVGAHVRPRDDTPKLDSPMLGGPRGSEFVFGLAAATRFALSKSGGSNIGVGPEFFGETAFKSAFGKYTTAVEALLSSHLTYLDAHGAQVRFKVGAGRGLNTQFGAPTWRMVLALEISDRVRK